MKNFQSVETKSSTTVDTSSRSLQFVAGGQNHMDCLVTNDTDKTIYVRFGVGSAPTAVVGQDTPIRSGAQIVLQKDAADYASFVAEASATGRVSFSAGSGS